MRKPYYLILLFVLISTISIAQKQITVADFTTKPVFSQKMVWGLNWMNDGQYYTSQSGNKIIKYQVTTGKEFETLIDGDAIKNIISIDDYSVSADEKKLLLQTEHEGIYRHSFKAKYFIFNIATKELKKLSSNGKQSYAEFSPDGSKIAFVRENNLFYTNLADGKETQVTNDGKFNHVINGSTDWVYEEEFTFAKAFFWSPDNKKLAFYRFDESKVKEYNMQKWNPGTLYPEDYKFKYPKAGEANSEIEIHVYDLASAQSAKCDIGTEKDIYIPRIQWTNNPELLSIRKLNRLQNKLDILHADAKTGKSELILTEKSKTYIDIEYCEDLIYTKDNKFFIYSSETNGYKHLYYYTIAGKPVSQITSGNWEVVKMLGFDEKLKKIFYTSTEGNYLNCQFYAISLDGKKKENLSQIPGNHDIDLSPDFQFYIDTYSSAAQPAIVKLYQTKGNTVIKELENNEKLNKTIVEYNISPKEFFQYAGADGTMLDGYMLKPAGFDVSKKYPVMVYQYSGPRSIDVNNSWAGKHFYFHQMLAQKGCIVTVIETRGTGSRGEDFAKMTYKQLGKYELEDILAAAKHLSALSFVDANRLGIWGWSYGGYMSSLAMTKGAGVYKLGIAVAPVTNWRYYDNIYTERFLQRPQENKSGYDDNSPSTYAANLKGDFLMVHGTGDDNVHFQNAVVLQDALIKAGKQFQSFYYPDKNHGLGPGIENRHHLYTMMLDFITEKLLKENSNDNG